MQKRQVADVVGCLLTGKVLAAQVGVLGVEGADELGVAPRGGSCPPDGFVVKAEPVEALVAAHPGDEIRGQRRVSALGQVLYSAWDECVSLATARRGWLSSIRCSSVVPERGQPTTNT